MGPKTKQRYLKTTLAGAGKGVPDSEEQDIQHWCKNGRMDYIANCMGRVGMLGPAAKKWSKVYPASEEAKDLSWEGSNLRPNG